MRISKDIDKLHALLNDNEFQDYVKSFREDNGPYTAEGWAELMVGVFVLKSWLIPVVAHYLSTDRVVDSLADMPVNIESSAIEGPLKLVLAPDITQPELKEWIDVNWAKRIKPLLDELPEKRYTIPKIKRDEAVYQDYLNRKKSGLNAIGISIKYNIHVSTVYRIVSRKKKNS